MADGLRRLSSRVLGWISLSLLLLAAVAVVVPVTMYVRSMSDTGLAVGNRRVDVHAPGDRTWGIYFNDRDNSGYSEACTVTDAAGRRIPLRDPGVTITDSDSEMLDHLFKTPSSGRFAIACSAQGATVRVGPVGSMPVLLVGLFAAALFGLGGLISGVVWLTRISAPPITTSWQASTPATSGD